MMRILVLANDDQQREILSIPSPNEFEFIFADKLPQKNELARFDLFMILALETSQVDFSLFDNKPVLINEMVNTLHELNLPVSVSRINGWPGFLKDEAWEIASNQEEKISALFENYNRNIFYVKDEPGFVSGRIISMIVNEAFFALGEKVSSTEEIDLAMKSGTNYPKGPFEWCEAIGVEKIGSLLEKLSESDERYLPAPALQSILEKSKYHISK